VAGLKNTNKFRYLDGEFNTSHEAFFARLAPSASAERSAARLNRELIEATDRWLDREVARETKAADLSHAAMHGIGAVIGSVIISLPLHLRHAYAQQVREHMLKIFDATTDALGASQPQPDPTAAEPAKTRRRASSKV
jgi:AcrR family transcriptional regulator